MTADHKDPDDPFADLVLDENFIAGATAYEAPARTRVAVARYGDEAMSRRRRSPRGLRRRSAGGPGAGPSRWPSGAGRIALVTVSAVLVAATGYLVVRSLAAPAEVGADDRASVTLPTPSADSASASASAESVELVQREFVTGDCYTWDQAAATAPARTVPCSGPHLFEATATTVLSGEDPVKGPYPTEAQWDAIADRHCLPAAEKYLSYPLDPHGRFGVGSVHPLPEGWALGERDLVCGLIATDDSAITGRFPTFEGAVRGVDQARVYPAGTCLALDAADAARVVSCDLPHESQSIGAIILPDTVTGRAPSESEFTWMAGSHCAPLAEKYPLRAPSGALIEPSYLVIDEAGWRAGTRKVTCLINFFAAPGRRVTVTGVVSPQGPPDARPASLRRSGTAPPAGSIVL